MVTVKRGKTRVRPAEMHDRQRIANIMHFEQYVHRHLGWRSPIEWVGRQPFLLAEEEGEPRAVLACPPDPPGVAWIHLFAVSGWEHLETYWDMLWEEARRALSEHQPVVCAALPLQPWFKRLLVRGGFQVATQVVMLSWDQAVAPPPRALPGTRIRPMALDDLPAVHAVDAAAFELLWGHSLPMLESAYRQAAIATVAESQGRIVGYQMSTATGHWGGHLARLAVLPEHQGRGIGSALVRDVLNHFVNKRIGHVTVNTQQENAASLRLYRALGFRLTGERMAMYACSTA